MNGNKLRVLLYMGYIIVMMAAFSCSSSPERNRFESFGFFTLDMNNPEGQTRAFFERIDSIRFLKLSQDSTFLMGFASKAQFLGNRYYVFDKSRANTLFVFDSMGNGLFKVGKVGRGPREYREISSFIVNDEYIILLDVGDDKLLYYALDGKNLFEHKTDAVVAAKLGPNMMALYDGANALKITNIKGELLKEHYVNTEGIKSIDPIFVDYLDSDLLFIEKVTQTVYQVTLDSLVPLKMIDLGPYQVTKSHVAQFSGSAPKNWFMNYSQSTMFHSEFGILESYAINDTWEMIMFSSKSDGFPVYRNLKTGTTYRFSFPLDNSGIDKGYKYLSWFPISSVNDFFVSILSPTQLITFMNKKDVDHPLLKRLQLKVSEMNISEEDNPVLMFYRVADW